jgi:hypothetical protein
MWFEQVWRCRPPRPTRLPGSKNGSKGQMAPRAGMAPRARPRKNLKDRKGGGGGRGPRRALRGRRAGASGGKWLQWRVARVKQWLQGVSGAGETMAPRAWARSRSPRASALEGTVIRKEQEPSCGSLLRKGEVFAYVGLIQNLKDLKAKGMAPRAWVEWLQGPYKVS